MIAFFFRELLWKTRWKNWKYCDIMGYNIKVIDLKIWVVLQSFHVFEKFKIKKKYKNWEIMKVHVIVTIIAKNISMLLRSLILNENGRIRLFHCITDWLLSNWKSAKHWSGLHCIYFCTMHYIALISLT